MRVIALCIFLTGCTTAPKDYAQQFCVTPEPDGCSEWLIKVGFDKPRFRK